MLRNVLQRATDWELILKNPVASVKRPKGNTNRKVNVYEPYEVKELFKNAHSQTPHWRISLSLALACGMRRGELLGLEWRNVDFVDGTIEIEQVVSRGGKRSPCSKGTQIRKLKARYIPPKISSIRIKRVPSYMEEKQVKNGRTMGGRRS